VLSKIREPVNGLTHFFAAFAAALGLIALVIIGWGQVGKPSVDVYGLSQLLLPPARPITWEARPKVIETLGNSTTLPSSS
jgi:hypothetical protein